MSTTLQVPLVLLNTLTGILRAVRQMGTFLVLKVQKLLKYCR